MTIIEKPAGLSRRVSIQGRGKNLGVRGSAKAIPGLLKNPLSSQPAGLCDGPNTDAGAVVSGARPTDLGTSGFIERANRLRANPDNRAGARAFGMEEVISDVTALCSESTFAISVESWADIVFTSDRSSVRLDLRLSSLVASC